MGSVRFVWRRLLVLLEVIYNICDGYKLVDVLICDFETKLVLAEHDQVCKLNRVDAKVIGELGLHLDIIGIQLKLVNKNVLQSFKHNAYPPK